MKLYWCLSSLPELRGLDFRDRRTAWKEAKRRARQESWFHWFIFSWLPYPTLAGFAVYGYKSLLSVWIQALDPEPLEFFLIIGASAILLMLIWAFINGIILAALRIALARPHIRAFLAGG